MRSDALRSCLLCERRCGADRSAGPAGACGAGPRPRVFRMAMSVSEEPELLPCFTVSWNGCDFACSFCVTGPNSQNASAGRPWSLDEAVAKSAGARTAMLLGGEPSVFLDHALEFAEAFERPVLKTNLFSTPDALALLAGVFEVVVADFKFGPGGCAQRLAEVENYWPVLTRNLEAGYHDLIVRHLVMPGHLECCTRPVIDWMRANRRDAKFSLWGSYLPAFRAAGEMARLATRPEVATARRWSVDAGLRLVA